MKITANDIAQRLQGQVTGDGTVVLTGFSPAASAKAGDLTFAENPEYFVEAEKSAASAILVAGDLKSSAKVLIRVKNARVAYAQVLPLFHPESRPPAGVHPGAVVAPSARVDASAHVGPHCVIGEGARIGKNVILHGGNHVGEDSVIGEDTVLFANVIVYPRTQLGSRVRIHAGSIIGSDGFGYVFDAGVHRKVPQVGNVIIHDDVEIGANVTIDRGALGSTVIGHGTKIDNLVQIGHNVTLGEHCIVVAQVGIAGSTRIGNYVTIAGQVGLAGHLKIGDKVTIAAQSGVMHDIGDGQKWMGSPAKPDREMKRELLALALLPALLRRVGQLEKQLAAGQTKPGPM
jgi:UDP-3-O-[3-hydroxymyristoyl] glucosamine N-acyltransferase